MNVHLLCICTIDNFRRVQYSSVYRPYFNGNANANAVFICTIQWSQKCPVGHSTYSANFCTEDLHKYIYKAVIKKSSLTMPIILYKPGSPQDLTRDGIGGIISHPPLAAFTHIHSRSCCIFFLEILTTRNMLLRFMKPHWLGVSGCRAHLVLLPLVIYLQIQHYAKNLHK